MGFYIDLEGMKLSEFKDRLLSTELLPSRKILKDDIEQNFALLEDHGFLTPFQLMKALNNKKKIAAFADSSKIDLKYLSVLVREIKSLRQSPVMLRDFPDTPIDMITKLENIGVKNALQLFELTLTRESRRLLADQLEIDRHDLLRLVKLMDLSRIKYVGHTFAYVLYAVGYDTAHKVATADAVELYETIKEFDQEHQLYKGNIGAKDMNVAVLCAMDVTEDIEY